MGAIQSTLFAFTAIVLARIYPRWAVDPEPVSAGVAHGSNSGSGTSPTFQSDVELVATTTDPEPTSKAASKGPPSPAVALTRPAIQQPSLDAAQELPAISASTHVPDTINSNSLNINNLVRNNNPNLLLSSSPGAIVNYNLIAHFIASEPDPVDTIQIKIATALKEQHVPQAAYDAQPGRGCMKGTRVQVLQSIENWILDLASQQICWLDGMAGAGKTAIAQTVCARVREARNIVLGGSFFCSRSTALAARRDVRCVVPTLAQLFARQSKEFSEALAAELNRDPDILHKQIDVQIKQLLYVPLLALKDSPIPILFVIDALDECGSHLIVSKMLEALVDFTRESVKLLVKFLVTSRPETHIRGTPVSDATFSKVLHLHAVNKEQVTADIRLYISTRLSSSQKLRSRFTDDDADRLARLADGLFIAAATALEYILHAGPDAAASRFRKLLDSARDGQSVSANAPLDHMYNFILTEATRGAETETDELQAMLDLLASILSARMTLSVAALADLLGVNSSDVRARLSRLHAVVYVPDEDHDPSMRTLHTSFEDYLLGRSPSSIRISASLGHGLLSRGCLRVMAERLHFNVSQSHSSYKSNPDTRPGTITLSLEYACLQWIRHIATLPGPSEFDAEINDVFRSRFLFWLEVMSVLGEVWRAASIMFLASSTVRMPELSKFFREANAFVTSSHEAIERSASHIYISALPFAPRNSLVYQTFAPLSAGLVSVDTFGIDPHGSRIMMTLTGHEDIVTSVVYSADGYFIGSGSEDGTVRIWDARNGQEVMSPLRSGDGEVLSVAFVPSIKGIAAGTQGGLVTIWSLLTGTRRQLRGHTGEIWSVAMSPDSAFLASASADQSVRLWETETGVHVTTFEGHKDVVRVVAFSPDGATLASGGDDRTIRLWQVPSGEPVGHLTNCDDGETSNNRESFLGICFSPDGTTLASGDTNGVVHLWNVQTKTIDFTLHGHSDWVRSVQFSPDGRSVVSASDDGTVRLWTIPQETAQASLIILSHGHTGDAYSASFSPDGLHVASAFEDRTIRIFDAGSDHQVNRSLPAHKCSIRSVAVSPCGSFIISGSDDLSVRTWSTGTGVPQLAPLLGHTKPVYSVAISANGRLIASASADHTIRLWDAHTGKAVGDPLVGHMGDVRAVVFSPDTRWLASGSDDCTVRMWNVETYMPSNIDPLHCTGRAYTVAFSTDGLVLAAGDSCGHIHLWCVDTGQALCDSLQADSVSIRSIALSPDGVRIVTGGDRRVICVWCIKTRRQLPSLTDHGDWVLSVVFSPNGELICSGSRDRTVRIWNATTSVPIATLHGHTDWVRSVAFTSDGRSVISCSDDKSIRVWDVSEACSCSSGGAEDSAVTLASALLRSGWLVGPSGELLLWVPVEYRAYLSVLPCTMFIGRSRIAVTVGSSGWHRGTHWTSCCA